MANGYAFIPSRIVYLGGGRKLTPKVYNRSDWKKQEENHTKTFAQSDVLSRGSFLKVMLTGAASAFSAGTGFARSLRSPVSRQSKPLVRGLTQDTRLYGSTAVEIGGKAKLDDLKISVDCSDSS